MHTADWIQTVCGIVMVPLGIYILRHREKVGRAKERMLRKLAGRFAGRTVWSSTSWIERVRVSVYGYALAIIGGLFIIRSVFFHSLFER
jgi:hypothetical protein